MIYLFILIFCRYVNEGKVVERFLCLHHIKDTTSESLKLALVKLLDHYKLQFQGYEGKGMTVLQT